MSLSGLKTLNENINKLHDSAEYKKLTIPEKAETNYALLNSKYGTGKFGFGKTVELPTDNRH